MIEEIVTMEEALEMLTTSYVVNQTLDKEPPQPNVCKVGTEILLSKNPI